MVGFALLIDYLKTSKEKSILNEEMSTNLDDRFSQIATRSMSNS
jgi:hypothetical protein